MIRRTIEIQIADDRLTAKEKKDVMRRLDGVDKPGERRRNVIGLFQKPLSAEGGNLNIDIRRDT